MAYRSDRRGGVPITPVTVRGRGTDWLPPGNLRVGLSQIRGHSACGLPDDLELTDQSILDYPISIEFIASSLAQQLFDAVESLKHMLEEEGVRLRHRK
jgi:hypothetical protein